MKPLFFFLLVILPITSTSSISPFTTLQTIKKTCTTSEVLYPSLCISSLTHYIPILPPSPSPSLLARLSINITRSHLYSLSHHLSSLSHHLSSLPSTSPSSALTDCIDLISDSISLSRASSLSLSRLRSGDDDVAWRVFDVQTWMSAVMTNEDTCVEGFDAWVVEDSGSGGGMKGDVCGRVQVVRRYTSVSLALVNSLVAN